MRIAILSRGKNLHSVRRFLQEAKKARVHCDIINPLDCQVVIDGKQSRILASSYGSGMQPLPHFDAVLPRIGASITDFGIAVVTQFEAQGMYVSNPARAISDSRDKLRCLQFLSRAGIRTPSTVLGRTPRGRRAAIESVGGLPAVLKLLRGTQGVGVMLVHTPVSLASVLDTLRSLDEDVIVQQFIAEGAGRDYRAFVIGNKVVAAMMRRAPEGEFRSNIHRGGEGIPVKLSPEFKRVAIRSARVLGLEVAGVDLMESATGPLVLEVNSSPGFEGIEKATKMNIAGMIIRHMVKNGRKNRGKSARK